MLYGDSEHVSLASLPDMAARTLTAMSFTKTYSMNGFRLGCVAGNKKLISQVFKVHEHSVSCAASFVQKAGVAALSGSQHHLSRWIKEFEERIKLIVDGLNRLPRITCRPPEGALYVFPDISRTGMTSLEFTELMLTEAKTVVTPGLGFGACGEGHVRISFGGSPRNRIEKALSLMEKALLKG
jgi:aspartate aminotransferase